MRKLTYLSVAAVLALAGCGGSQATDLDGFVGIAARGIHLDCEPLAGPADAVAKSDLVVTGTLADIREGVRVVYPDPAYTERRAGSYATYVVRVDSVVSGNPAGVAGGHVYVAVAKSRSATIEELAAANPHPRVVVVLSDLGRWDPGRGATVQRPSAVPADAPMQNALCDGLWLQDTGAPVMRGVHAQVDDLAPGWEGIRTVDAYATAIRAAG